MRNCYTYIKSSLLGCALALFCYWYLSSHPVITPHRAVTVSSSLNAAAMAPAVQAAGSVKRPALDNEWMQQVKASANQILFEQNTSTDSNVLVSGHSSTGQLTIYQDGLLLFTSVKYKKNEGKDNQPLAEHHTWGIQLLGANNALEYEVKQPLETKVTHIVANSSRSTATYGEVVLKQVYKGIDLRLYSQKNGNLEFDWIIAPGADVNAIRMQYKGQDRLKIKEKGGLEVALRFGKVHFNIPESYQLNKKGEKKPVEAAYAMKEQENNIVGYKVLNRDPALSLIIDPEVVWATYIDGDLPNFDGYLYTLDVDNAGNVYCGGYSANQLNINTGVDPYNNIQWGYSSSLNQILQPVVYKVKPDGSAITWLTYIDGGDRIISLALSPSQNVLFAIGPKLSNQSPLPIGNTAAFDPNAVVSVFNTPGFVIALDAATLGNAEEGGALLYATYIDYRPGDILPLSDDSYVIGGQTQGQDGNTISYISSSGVPVSSLSSSNTDGIIQKFTAFNKLSWGTYTGCSSGFASVNALRLLSDGQIAFLGIGSYESGRTKLVNSCGSFVWYQEAAVVGVVADNAGTNWSMFSLIGADDDPIDIDFSSLDIKKSSPGNDEIWFAGSIESTNIFPGVGGSFRSTPGGLTDVIVGKLPQGGRPAGAPDPLKATYLGGANLDRTPCLKLINEGNQVMVYGITNSTDFPTCNSVFGGSFFDATLNGDDDMFLTVLNTSLEASPGTLIYSTYIGGTRSDYTRMNRRPLVLLPDQKTFVVAATSHSRTSFQPDIFAAGGFDHDPNDNPEDKHLLLKLRLNNIIAKDYGDMPVVYGKAEHQITAATYNGTTPRLALGSKLDIEGFYNTSVPVAAEGDDVTIEQTNIGDDEDAFSGLLPAVSGATYTLTTVPVTNTTGGNAIVYGFIDFNNDGDFNDAGEEASIMIPNGATDFTINWSGYGTGSAARYVRLRIAPQAFWAALSTPAARSAAVMQEGEVEDHVISSTVLPLTLKSFTATWQEEHAVRVKWSVENEAKIKNYTVQRSADATHWQSMGSVNARGVTAGVSQYQYNDPLSAEQTKVYYRIQYTDLDNRVEYTRVERLYRQRNSGEVSVKPNPFKNSFQIDFKEMVRASQLQIKIIDLQGRSLEQVGEWSVVTPHSVQVNGQRLMPGVYILQVQYAGQFYEYKLVKKD